MKKILSALALSLTICTLVSADVILSFEFYEVGTDTPIAQPIQIGDMFEMAVLYEDLGSSMGAPVGVAQAAFAWTFDPSLLTQNGPLVSNAADGWSSGGTGPPLGTGLTATGGTFDERNNSIVPANPIPSGEMFRVKYTADAVGSAMFATNGGGVNELFATVSTGDSWGFNSAGDCLAMGAIQPCPEARTLTFGTGKVTIVPEPTAMLMWFVGIAALLVRR